MVDGVAAVGVRVAMGAYRCRHMIGCFLGRHHGRHRI